MILLVIFGGVTIAGYALLHIGVASWILAAVITGLYYVRDVNKHDRVRCRICRGGDEKSRIGGGSWFRVPFGDCWCCGGKGYHPRLALRVISPDQYKDIKTRIQRAKGKD